MITTFQVLGRLDRRRRSARLPVRRLNASFRKDKGANVCKSFGLPWQFMKMTTTTTTTMVAARIAPLRQAQVVAPSNRKHSCPSPNIHRKSPGLPVWTVPIDNTQQQRPRQRDKNALARFSIRVGDLCLIKATSGGWRQTMLAHQQAALDAPTCCCCCLPSPSDVSR